LDLSHCFELSHSFDTAGILANDLSVLNRVFVVLTQQSCPSYSAVKVVKLDNLFVSMMGEARLTWVEESAKQAGVSLEYTDFFTSQGWDLARLSELFRIIQGVEIISKHGKWLAVYGDTLDKPIAERVRWARTLTATAYRQAINVQNEFRRQVESLWLKPGEVAVIPTTLSGPPRLDMPSSLMAAYRSQLMGLTSVAGLCGFPQLHLPLPVGDTGPWGVSLFARAWQEPELLALARQLCDQGAAG
jgi:aspartyl-tRNA(Asn)/glutamyl-tRNA(Gln) amidotransferase subunit A